MNQTIKAGAIAAAILAPFLLPYATNANFNGRQVVEAKSMMLPAAPIEFLNIFGESITEQSGIGLAEFPPPIFALEHAGFGPAPRTRNLRAAGRASVTQEIRRPAKSRGQELDVSVDRISFDTPTLAPMAFMRFCLRYADDCEVTHRGLQSVPIALSETRKAELTKINREVNRAIRPEENVQGVMAEEWEVSPQEGDCNDYAVTKRHKLLQLGWPSHALLLSEVVVPSGEHHLVLVVRTQEEDLVLDNLSWNVRSVSQIHYRWVRAQLPANPKFWSEISVARAARLSMNIR